MDFTGAAKLDSFLFQKVITSGTSQVGQFFTIILNLSSYIGNRGYPGWVGSIRTMEMKAQNDYIPALVGRSAYGTVTAGIFIWNGNTIDTEDKYNRNVKI